MKQSVLFLDIDGVVYPCKQRRIIRKDTHHIRTQIKNHGYQSALMNDMDLCASAYGFDPHALYLLKELIQKTNATIVISSSWKLLRDLQTMKALFSLHDMDNYIFDMTVMQVGYSRRRRYARISKHMKFKTMSYSTIYIWKIRFMNMPYIVLIYSMMKDMKKRFMC